MDLILLSYFLVMASLLIYSAIRLRARRDAVSLAVFCAGISSLVFMIFIASANRRSDQFAFLIAFALGFIAPVSFLVYDVVCLQSKIMARLSINLSAFLYGDDRAQVARIVRKEIFVDSVLMPRADNFPLGAILEEMEGERHDTIRNVQKLLETAGRLFNEDDLDSSYAAFLSIERVFRRSASLYFNMGNIKYVIGDFESAARDYERASICAYDKSTGALATDASRASAIWYNLGNSQFMRGKYGRAIDAYKKSIEMRQDNEAAYFNLSFCHAMDFEETGDSSAAAAEFAKILENVPNSAFAWLHYGICLYKTGDFNGAQDRLQRAIAEDPACADARFWLAQVLDERKAPEEAIASYRKALELNPDYVDAYNNLGILLSTSGRHGEALAILRDAIRKKPSDTKISLNIGIVLYNSGKPDEALEELLSANRQNPSDSATLYMIAVVLASLNNRERSTDFLKRSIKANPALRETAKNEEVFQKYATAPEFAELLV